jgi:hypothetical protein
VTQIFEANSGGYSARKTVKTGAAMVDSNARLL